MSDREIVIIWAIGMLLLFGLAIAVLRTVKEQPLDIRRKISNRTETAEGELLELECGHFILIRRHRLDALACEQCAQISRKQESNDGQQI